jgi:hypothetical protein
MINLVTRRRNKMRIMKKKPKTIIGIITTILGILAPFIETLGVMLALS